MWPCHQGARRKITIWGHLIALSFVVHLGVLFILFFAYREYYTDIIKVGARLDAPVVFLPLYKRVGTQLNTHTRGRQKAGAQKSTRTPSNAQKKSAASKTQHKKTVLDAHAQKPAPKKKTAEKKKPAQKPNPQPEQPKAQKEKPQEQTVQQEQAQSPVEQKIAQAAQEIEAPSDQESPLYIGQAERDFMIMHEQIQREIEEHWRPPAGMVQGNACHVRVVVDWNGKVATTTFQQSSGILIYDMSVRSCLAAMQFPHSARGKEIVIHFST